MTGRHFEADIDGIHVIQTETLVVLCFHRFRCRFVCPVLCLIMEIALTDSNNNPFVALLHHLQKSVGLRFSQLLPSRQPHAKFSSSTPSLYDQLYFSCGWPHI
jgi:hypothetical protein